jgi:hypothetical protein
MNGVYMSVTSINSKLNSMLSINAGGGVRNQEIYGLVNSPCGLNTKSREQNINMYDVLVVTISSGE